MTFREATDGIPAEVLARAFGVQAQTVRQYRLDPSSVSYRPPPAGWRSTVALVLQDRGTEYLDRAALLAGNPPEL
jgi:hypothetical protein